ncbi:4'-phosphopantetheinyl transferase family protein [Yeosuana sp.]|uniref:4'-phosphopantetheinyl transferase family protein n=1 Tax=Yeosuana sp. TaxID=2529388 RepID=UPI0040551B53|tara:strand:+ start:342 stop:917 length:576 start_codon:yes stop_codon:yes gene_type:complete
MIGNDIVDLNMAAIESNWKRPRFLNKVFTTYEQQLIADASNQNQTVWLLWSMKEAAYKIYVQQFGIRFFNPLKLVCSLDSKSDGFVTIGNTTFFTKSVISEEYIYTIAVSKNSKNYNSECLKVENKSYLIQSDTLKNRFLEIISENKNLNIEHLNINKNEVGVPEVFFKNSKLPIHVSLTHSGNYCGYVYF